MSNKDNGKIKKQKKSRKHGCMVCCMFLVHMKCRVVEKEVLND